jgi:hypothetical protein
MPFREHVSGAGFVSPWSGAWKPLAVIGVNLILLALLIFVFPALLAYLIAAFLLFDGSLLLAGAYWIRRREREMREQRQVWRESLDPAAWN